MAVELREINQCLDFFQQTILRTVQQWHESEAVQQVDVPVLDQNRLTILNIINRGLEYQPSWPELKELVIAFASYMERRGHWDVWRDILDASIEVAQSLADVDAEITLTALFARLSQRQSRGDDVVRFYRQVIRLAKRHGDHFEEARACSNLGFYYINSGHWWRSEVLSCHALALFEQLGNEHGLAHTHNHLGLLYTQKGNHELAASYLSHACNLWEKIGDDHNTIHGLLNLSQLYLQNNHPDSAIRLLLKTEQLCRTSGTDVARMSVYLNLGHAYRQSGDLDAALRYTLEAKKKYSEFGNMLGLARSLNNLGLIHQQQNQREEAGPLLIESLDRFRSLGDVEGEVNLLGDLINLHVDGSNHGEAWRYFNQLEMLLKQAPFVNQQRYMDALEEIRRTINPFNMEDMAE